jgi:hypothetical protein
MRMVRRVISIAAAILGTNRRMTATSDNIVFPDGK